MKKFFFLALMAFLWLPTTTWANDTGEEWSTDSLYDETGHSIETASVSLKYKVLTAATANDDSETGWGTVELEGLGDSSADATVGSLSISHVIVHAEFNMSTMSADIYYYEVVGIAMGAFGGYTSGNTTLTSVTIPYTVTYLGEDTNSTMEGGCFSNCTNLTTVIFAESTTTPSRLETIGTNAFYKCTSLTSIDIPSTVTTIASNAFANCSSLTEVKIPEGVTSMGSNEFQGCTKLETVWMPGSLTLTARVFDSCTSLKNIVLEGGPGTNGGNEGSNAFANDNGEAITLYVETGRAAEYLASAWETDVENESSSNAVLSWNFNEIGIYYDFYEEEEDGEQVNYATYYTDAVGEFYSDVTPNIVTKAGESGEITYTAVTGYIPANTGLLLSAPQSVAPTADFATYYYHPYETTISSVETADVSSNMLLGTNDEGGITTVGPNGESEGYYFYKLSLDSDETVGTLGFYWGVEGGGAFKSAAGKAYLAVAVSSGDDDPAPTHYSFKKDEGDTTGISAVESASEKAVSGIYTIQGVRVSNMNQPGLYIVDGKKVLVK